MLNKYFFLFFFLLLIPQFSFGAIAFDSIYDLTVFGPGTSITNTIDIGSPSADSIMIVAGNGHSASNAITSITWNGVALTQVQVQAPAGNNDRYLYIYYLINPSPGSNNLVINNNTSAYFFGDLAIYTGVAQTGQPDSSGKGTGSSSGTFSQTTTIITDNSWMIGWVHRANGSNVTAGTGTTMRGTASGNALGDSNGSLLSGSRTLNFAHSSSDTWTGVYLSLAPSSEPIEPIVSEDFSEDTYWDLLLLSEIVMVFLGAFYLIFSFVR